MSSAQQRLEMLFPPGEGVFVTTRDAPEGEFAVFSSDPRLEPLGDLLVLTDPNSPQQVGDVSTQNPTTGATVPGGVATRNGATPPVLDDVTPPPGSNGFNVTAVVAVFLLVLVLREVF